MSLDITNPELIIEWDEEKNGSMKNYTHGSGKKISWICSINSHHQWQSTIKNRTYKKRTCPICPICINQLICPIDQCNSLYYNCNNQLKQEWNEEKNGSMKNYTLNSDKKVWWKCNKIIHHKWQTTIKIRRKSGCPICVNKIICPIDQCNSLYYNCNNQLKQEWIYEKL